MSKNFVSNKNREQETKNLLVNKRFLEAYVYGPIVLCHLTKPSQFHILEVDIPKYLL